jgi:hypothetical protein
MRCVVFACVVLLGASGCVGPEDNPSNVKDLRVLGIRVDPPELLADSCPADFSNPAALLPVLAPLARPLRLTALLADPAGQGRELDYTLWACGSASDSTCTQDRVELARGIATEGELVVSLNPSPLLAQLPDGTPLVQRVVERVQQSNPLQLFGGLRLPLVLWVRAGSEQVYAQKLMVYGCRFFPEMRANEQPELPGLLLEGQPWEEGTPRELKGPGPFRMEPVDFTALQVPYIVPSYELTPVNLEERWLLSWHTTQGVISPTETGGAGFDGESGRHRAEWQPFPNSPAGEVRFWVVVRDGRGGLTWVSRAVSYTP